MATKMKCPECGSARVWRKGATPSRKGPKPRYVCFACGRTFYEPKKPARKPRSSKG